MVIFLTANTKTFLQKLSFLNPAPESYQSIQVRFLGIIFDVTERVHYLYFRRDTLLFEIFLDRFGITKLNFIREFVPSNLNFAILFLISNPNFMIPQIL